MTAMRYTALCTRSGDWWAIRVPELRGGFTQARRLSQAEAMVRDLVSLAKGVPADSFEVTLVADLPADVAAEVDAARELRETAERYQREATSAARAAAGTLAGRCGLTVRDIGRILGVSHQRAHQLLIPRE
jgi:hypothetical protein